MQKYKKITIIQIFIVILSSKGQTQGPGLKPGAIDILPFQGMDNIRPARINYSQLHRGEIIYM